MQYPTTHFQFHPHLIEKAIVQPNLPMAKIANPFITASLFVSVSTGTWHPLPIANNQHDSARRERRAGAVWVRQQRCWIAPRWSCQLLRKTSSIEPLPYIICTNLNISEIGWNNFHYFYIDMVFSLRITQYDIPNSPSWQPCGIISLNYVCYVKKMEL